MAAGTFARWRACQRRPRREHRPVHYSVSSRLSAKGAAYHTGRAACAAVPARVKRMRLSDYRVVAFATHDLVAGISWASANRRSRSRSGVEHPDCRANTGTAGAAAWWEPYIGGRNICCLFISCIDHI